MYQLSPVLWVIINVLSFFSFLFYNISLIIIPFYIVHSSRRYPKPNQPHRIHTSESSDRALFKFIVVPPTLFSFFSSFPFNFPLPLSRSLSLLKWRNLGLLVDHMNENELYYFKLFHDQLNISFLLAFLNLEKLDCCLLFDFDVLLKEIGKAQLASQVLVPLT